MNQDELKTLRQLIQKNGWEEFMSNVGSLMAEQADKTVGSQSGALFSSSNTIHALRRIWKECGFFKYPEDLVGN